MLKNTYFCSAQFNYLNQLKKNNMNMYDTYIFDLDGTLLSTLNDLAASCNYALENNGMPKRSIDEVRQFVGNGVKKLRNGHLLVFLQLLLRTSLLYPAVYLHLYVLRNLSLSNVD